jgi:hypothetical protein
MLVCLQSSLRSQRRADGDGNHIHNLILLDLPSKEREMLIPKLELVRLKIHHVLHEARRPAQVCLFLRHRLGFHSECLPRWKECGSRSGCFVGLPLVADFRTAPTRAVAKN